VLGFGRNKIKIKCQRAKLWLGNTLAKVGAPHRRSLRVPLIISVLESPTGSLFDTQNDMFSTHTRTHTHNVGRQARIISGGKPGFIVELAPILC